MKEPEYDPRDYPLPKMQLHMQSRTVTRCQADDDDMCDYERCPQLRDGEPKATGRHCPLDKCPDDDPHV